LLVVFICSAQAITTEELTFSENAQARNLYRLWWLQCHEPGAYGQESDARPGRSVTAGSTIVWTGNAYDPDGDKLLYQFWLNGPMTGIPGKR